MSRCPKKCYTEVYRGSQVPSIGGPVCRRDFWVPTTANTINAAATDSDPHVAIRQVISLARGRLDKYPSPSQMTN